MGGVRGKELPIKPVQSGHTRVGEKRFQFYGPENALLESTLTDYLYASNCCTGEAMREIGPKALDNCEKWIVLAVVQLLANQEFASARVFKSTSDAECAEQFCLATGELVPPLRTRGDLFVHRHAGQNVSA